MNTVVSISNARSLVAKRAEALIGREPTFTFHPDPADGELCFSVRLCPVGDGRWVGVIGDTSHFADRIRLGGRPRFVVHHNGETPIVCGDADVRILGRVLRENRAPEGLSPELDDAASRLLAGSAFEIRDGVLVEVSLSSFQIDEGEAPVHGAIPRS